MFGRSFGEAYAKAQLASGVMLPRQGAALLSVRERDKDGVVELGRILTNMGFDLVATHGTAQTLADAGVSCRRANKVREGRPHIVDMIKNGEIDLIVNTTEGKQGDQRIGIDSRRGGTQQRHLLHDAGRGDSDLPCHRKYR